METNRAEEHLQTIRTLMERSAVYRRALAPIMVWNGIVGVAGGWLGWYAGFRLLWPFIAFWSAAAALGMIGSFLLIRRQALKDSEPFWSPPTRRVAQALLPPLLIGGFVNVSLLLLLPLHFKRLDPIGHYMMIMGWLWLYGCAACSAGFFMTRGIRLFGWFFIGIGGALIITMWLMAHYGVKIDGPWFAYLLMGSTFGGLHLAYGVYLYVTEKRKQAA